MDSCHRHQFSPLAVIESNQADIAKRTRDGVRDAKKNDWHQGLPGPYFVSVLLVTFCLPALVSFKGAADSRNATRTNQDVL